MLASGLEEAQTIFFLTNKAPKSLPLYQIMVSDNPTLSMSEVGV